MKNAAIKGCDSLLNLFDFVCVIISYAYTRQGAILWREARPHVMGQFPTPAHSFL